MRFCYYDTLPNSLGKHTGSILQLGPNVCVHGMQRLPNECCPFLLLYLMSLHVELVPPPKKKQTIDGILTLWQIFLRLINEEEKESHVIQSCFW